jgi:hypothetical protein
MITKENYIIAYFIDNERKNIEVLLRDGNKVNSHIVEYNTMYPVCKELLNVITIDDLHKNTYSKKQEQVKEFEEMAIRVAKKSGIAISNESQPDMLKFYPQMVKAIFEGVTNENQLFALKLALFEVEKIRDSKDNELKRKLRQSANKIDVLKVAFDIMNG